MTLPTIDIAAWRAGDPATRIRIALTVDDALRTSGFLLAINHAISPQLAADVRAEAQRFFTLDPTAKERYRTRVGNCGWLPPGAEANSYASGVESPPDMKETYRFVPDTVEATEENVWPTEVPTMRPVVVEYLRDVWSLAIDLFDIFSAALALSDGALTAYASTGMSSMNVNRYPSLNDVGPATTGQFRVGAHSDFGVLTILDRQPGYGGLQIQTADGERIDAPDVPGALTINIGDLLARWTGDRWRSTVHRVLPPSVEDTEEELVSLVAFCGVEPSTVISTLVADAPMQYEPVVAGEYLRAKLDAIDVA